MPSLPARIADADRGQKDQGTRRFRLISPFRQTQARVLGVKTSNWHVFPIDNPVAWATMAIAGARASSYPPRLTRGNRND
jgi:hypothetical protein